VLTADLQLIKMNAYNSQYSAGQYAFDRTYTQGPDPNQSTLNGGNGMATMLLGLPIAGALTISNRLFLYNKYYGFYVADDFHVNKKLTLNLGLRYEYTTPYAEKFGNLSYFDFNGTEPLTGRKGVLKFIKPGGYQSDPKRLNFSPRVGFAYQLNSKTVIRSAGAIFYAANNGLNNAATDFGTGGFTSNFLYLGQTNPLGASTPPIGGSWENPFAAGITGIDKTSSFAGRAVRADTRNHPLAYVSNWTLSIQRMVTSTLMVEGAYVGSKITHLFWNRQNNQDSPLLLPLGNQLLQPVANPFIGQIKTGALSGPTITLRQALRPYPQYLDVLIFRDPYGDSEYESATLRVEKQYARGLTFSAGYTFSKAIASTGESNTWVVGPSNALYNPKYNRSLEANDLTHRLVLSYVWDTPIGIGKPYLSHGVVGRVLGNWEVTGITVIQGGRPILITAPDNTHLLNFSYTNGRANRLHDPVLSHGQGTQEWFDTTAFAEAPAFTVPNDSLSQPHLRGPGLVSFNVGAFKNIPFKERLNFQFRAEFFNIFNHPALEVRYSSTDVTSSQFGQIVSGGGERNIQLGVRVIF